MQSGGKGISSGGRTLIIKDFIGSLLLVQENQTYPASTQMVWVHTAPWGRPPVSAGPVEAS